MPVRTGAPARAAPSARGALEVRREGETIEGRAQDLDPRVLRRLRQGDPPAEAELDLHGLTEAEAGPAVARWLRDRAAEGRRCVRIVTGRGLHSQGAPRLREAVPGWLAVSAEVRAFVIAPTRHGGAGALHVLLRIKRD